MPKREPLRSLRRAFKRVERFARETGHDQNNFDTDPVLSEMTPEALIDMATKGPPLRSSNRKAQLPAVRSSMLVLAQAELKLTKEVENDGEE